ncbi:MAG TPA: HEAT repeat domain-containing protein [Archangium sp.]|uniref:HEAT repeat domain-containing protein n=1 Tax=Archangium sp. TaxID=1872627 RepID=UPI002E306E3D|nr:HEAT repeat domain-containing protein [Archangium sp.]HEX5744740.1 HEAT repeat domain-containing protein [Archangium sp.]
MSGKRSRTMLLLIPLVLLGGLGAWWGLSRPEQPAPPQEAVRPSQPAPAAQTPAATPAPPAQKTADGTRAWVPGTLYRYSLSADQKIAFRKKRADAQTMPEMKFNLQGEWNVGVVSATETRVDARVQLKLSTLSVLVEGNPVAPDAREAMTRAMELPFFFSMDKTGMVVLTHFENDADSLVRGIHRALVAGSQFVVAGVPQDTWKTEELDTTGRYVAEYVRQTPERFEKNKKSYTHLITPQGLEPMSGKISLKVRAGATFELEKDLWARSVDATEQLDVDSADELMAATYENTLRLRLQQRMYDPSLFNSFKARQGALSSAPMASFGGVQQDPLDQYRQVLGGKNFDTLVKDLRTLPKDPLERDDARARALEQMRALFMLQPGEALKVPEIIRSGMEPDAASPMLGALSAASNKESIQALSTVMGDGSLPHDIRMDSVAAMGMAGEPNRQGVDALREMTRNPDPMLRDTAVLGLGNAAYQMGDDNARDAESLVFELNNSYRTASTPEQQALALRALGNTRSPTMMSTLQEALGSPDPRIRTAAIEALRNVPGTDADQLLSQYLLADPASEVRRAAVFSASYRPLPPLLPALGQALRKDAVDGVRADVIRLLGAVRGVLPEAMALIAWSSQNDPNADIRQMALMYVNTPATPVPQAGPATP